MATTGSRLNERMFSMCLARLPRPPAGVNPPWYFTALAVATITAALGCRPAMRHLMLKNFSAPRSLPKPASVTTTSASFSASSRGDGPVGALGDVGERPGVDERGRAFQRLHQVRMDRIAEQHQHRAFGLDVAGEDGLALVGERHHHVAQPPAQIDEIAGQAEDGHHFGGGRDVEPVLPRHAVLHAAQADEDLAQGAVVQVDHPPQHDPPRVDAQFVAVLQVVVQHRGQQVVGLLDGVHVADEVQVDVLGRHDLARPAPVPPPLMPKYGPNDGSRRQIAVRFPSRRKASPRPIVVVVLPSPVGVGVIAVTSTRSPSG